MAETFLQDVVVVELGDRLSAGLCGGLLQRLGAEVIVVEPTAIDALPESKWPHRLLLGAGKRAIEIDWQSNEDLERLREHLERADVVVTSSDWGPALPETLSPHLEAVPVVCDVSAFGSAGPLKGERYTDSMMQAFAGLMDTTGVAGEAPIATRIPITECTAAVFAAAGVLTALRARRMSNSPVRVEVAMFDTAVSMLSTFLPKHFIGESPQRMGNRHPSMSPWNAYPARDGWLLLCSASDDMWGRVCEVIARPELKHDPRFRSMSGRVEHAPEADAALEPWIASHSVDECLAAFNAASVPCGPVYDMKAVLNDPSVRARGAVQRFATRSGRELLVPGRLFHGVPAQGCAPGEDLTSASAPGARAKQTRHPPSCAAPARHAGGVLAGLRVLEMGSYTTAPLAARNLGALGAYVVKLEPPSGELSRASPPYRDGQSYFCTLSNSDKRSVAIDLRSAEGRALFRELVSKADVFVENMKPGVLARYGFGPAELVAIAPRLVYCSVSGYGASSPLADLPAMDTTIQGMAGIMNLTRAGGVPYKTGISIADLLGGQFALLAILAGLEYRERTGRGQLIDLSMQELSTWLTQFHWNGDDDHSAEGRVLRCRDGYVYVSGAVDGASESSCVEMTKAQAAAALDAKRLRGAPVNTVSEVALHAQTAARELIVERPSSSGKVWPLLASPIRLTPFSPEVRRAFGAVGEDLEEVVSDWDLASSIAGRTGGAA